MTAAFFAMNGTHLTGMGDKDPAGRANALATLKVTVSAKGANLNLLVRRVTTEMTALMIAADAGAADAVRAREARGQCGDRRAPGGALKLRGAWRRWRL